MSNPPPSAGQPYNSYVNRPPTNPLGLVGFITSLVGIVTCGFVAPLGLVLSLIGLYKKPRGLALAGTIISLVGSAFLIMLGIGIVMSMLGIGKAAKSMSQTLTTQDTARKASAVIVASQTTTGKLPADDAGDKLIHSFTDAWQTPLHYKNRGETFEIISAGEDKQFDTQDDMRYTREELDLGPARNPYN
jgi:hypothetical protein